MFCPACGNNNVSGSQTCSKCGAALPASATTPPTTVAPTTQTKAPPLIAGASLAGIGDRAIATILDAVMVGAAYALVGMWAAVRWGGVTSNGFKLYSTAANVAFGIVVIFGFLYVWLLEGVLGATLGKFILAVRVRRIDGSPIGLKQSLVRNLLRVIDGIGIYLVGFLIAIFSHLKQRLGDHLAKTVVVQSDSGPLPRAVAVVVWAGVILAAFVGAYRLHPSAEAAAARVGRVIRAELGTDRTPDYEIVNPSNEFYTDTPRIVCVGKVEGVDPGVAIKAVWIADDTGGAAPPNYKIDENSFSGGDEFSANLSSPTNGWPVGRYHLEIYIRDKLAKKVPFTIKQR